MPARSVREAMQQEIVSHRGLHSSTDRTLLRAADAGHAVPLFFELPEDPFDEQSGFGGFAEVRVEAEHCSVGPSSGGTAVRRHGQRSIEGGRDKWYLRLQLPTNCLAELWVRDVTPHNVLAWSDGNQNWVPLLAVPELREAIRSAQDKKTRDLLRPTEPPGDGHEPLPRPRGLGSGSGTRADQVMRSWSMPVPSPRPPSLVPSPLTVATVPAPCPPSTMPPPAVVSSRLSTMPPPAMAMPAIPRPARLPVFCGAERGAIASAALPLAATSDQEGTLTPPNRATVPAPPPVGKLLSIVNLERALWLSAGVSIATGAFLVMQGPAARSAPSDGDRAASTAVVAGTPKAQTGERCEPPRVEPLSGVASAEELPLVGKDGKLLKPSKSKGATSSQVARAPATPATHRAVGAPAQTQKWVAPSAPASVPAGSFDPMLARRVLSSAASRARSCADGPISGSVLVTFAPSGFVQSASLASVQGEAVRQPCVLRAFQEARVSPFEGAPVSVKKSF